MCWSYQTEAAFWNEIKIQLQTNKIFTRFTRLDPSTEYAYKAEKAIPNERPKVPEAFEYDYVKESAADTTEAPVYNWEEEEETKVEKKLNLFGFVTAGASTLFLSATAVILSIIAFLY